MRRALVGQRPAGRAQTRPRVRCHWRDFTTLMDIGRESMLDTLTPMIRELARDAYRAGQLGDPCPITDE